MSDRVKACGAGAVLAGNQYWCDRDDGHTGPHTNEKHQAAWGSSIQFEKKEATVIPEIDNDPFDALQLAVQLHSERYQYQDVTSETVLQTAEAFLAWLRAKKEGDQKMAAPDHRTLKALPSDDDHPAIPGEER